MSVREEDRRKNSCPSRGLGLAADAIGVGVGAALYYFFSKRPENPDSEGSTSQGWSCEQPQALDISASSNKSDYTTISEHTTTDTSIHDDGTGFFTCTSCNNCNRNNDSIISIGSTSSSNMDISDEYSDSFDHHEDELSPGTTDDEFELGSEMDYSSDNLSDNDSDTSSETGYITLRTMTSTSDNHRSSFNTDRTLSDSSMDNDWDVTNSSEGIPRASSHHMQMMHSLFSQITDLVSPSPNKHLSEDDQMRILREQAFRERAWTLEECAICFEVMLKDQPLVGLPCTHNFHVACIGPWLQEHQTCPVCRKAAE